MSGNIGLYLARPRHAPPHSCLSATRGSTRARRAGSQHATRATAIHTATAADHVTALLLAEDVGDVVGAESARGIRFGEGGRPGSGERRSDPSPPRSVRRPRLHTHEGTLGLWLRAHRVDVVTQDGVATVIASASAPVSRLEPQQLRTPSWWRRPNDRRDSRSS
jgi:hypothetical protein